MLRRLTQACWNSPRLAARFCQALSAPRNPEEDSVTRLINNPTFLAESAVAGFIEFEDFVRGLPIRASKPFGKAVPPNLMKIYSQLIKTQLAILPNMHKFVTLALNVRDLDTDQLANDMLRLLLGNQEGWSVESASNYLSVLYQLLSYGVANAKEMNTGHFDDNLARTIAADQRLMTRIDSIRLALKINQVNELLAENGFRELANSFKEVTKLVPSNLIAIVLASPESADFEELVELLELAHYGLNDVSNTLGLLQVIEQRIEQAPELPGLLEVDHILKVLRGIGRGGSFRSPKTLQLLEAAVVRQLSALSLEELLLVLRVYGLAGQASHLFAAELERHVGLHAAQFSIREALEALTSFTMLRKRIRQKAFSLFDGLLEKQLHKLDINEAVGFLRIFETVQLRSYPSREALLERVFSTKSLSEIRLSEALYLVELVLELREPGREIELLTQLNLKIEASLESASDSLEWENLLYVLASKPLLGALSADNREGLFSHIASCVAHEGRFSPSMASALVLRLDDAWDSGCFSKTEFLEAYGRVLTAVLQKIATHRECFFASQALQLANFFAKLCHEPWDQHLAVLNAPAGAPLPTN